MTFVSLKEIAVNEKCGQILKMVTKDIAIISRDVGINIQKLNSTNVINNN